MSKREKLLHSDRLYKCEPSPYCGLLVKDHVMRKLQKITAKFETEIRHIFNENIDDIELYGWGLASKNGKQMLVSFAEPAKKGEKEERIKLFRADRPEYRAEVYMCRAFSDDADKIIKEIEEEK